MVFVNTFHLTLKNTVPFDSFSHFVTRSKVRCLSGIEAAKTQPFFHESQRALRWLADRSSRPGSGASRFFSPSGSSDGKVVLSFKRDVAASLTEPTKVECSKDEADSVMFAQVSLCLTQPPWWHSGVLLCPKSL